MEREKFEASLKKSFEQAEISPSHQVWTNIELDLEKAKGGELKRSLFFYKMLAAASVVFAMAIGGVGYYQTLTVGNGEMEAVTADTRSTTDVPPGSVTPSQGIASAETSEGTSRSGQESDRVAHHDLSTADAPNNTGQDATATGKDPSRIAAKDQSTSARQGRSEGYTRTNPTHAAEGFSESEMENRSADGLAATSGENNVGLPVALQERQLPPLYTPRDIQLSLASQEENEVDPVVAMLAELEQREREIQGEEKEKDKKDDNRHENLWTSVGFSAGSFTSVQNTSPNPGAAPSLAMDLTAPVVDEESSASGYSYSMGVNIGTRISERWVFQGGVNYLTHASEYTANNVVATSGYQQQRFRAMSTNELINTDVKELNTKLVISAPYSVNNSMRYLSIPMQAGYLLVNKTFGLQLNAGVATDLFLQNTIKAESDHLDKTSQPAGEDSPYRAVNLSGLFGTEVSYRFGENYRISLNPGIRYPFNTIYKSELGVQSSPLTFDIGLRFRYIFH